jgi:helix-turn-helix protein
LRLDAAKRLLLTTSLSVTDICFEVGYSSLGSFTTRFTQLVGLPPHQLRQVAQDFTMPSLESLHDSNTYTFCHVPSFGGCFFGRISAPGAFKGPIFVGLFPKLDSPGGPLLEELNLQDLSPPGRVAGRSSFLSHLPLPAYPLCRKKDRILSPYSIDEINGLHQAGFFVM